MDSTKDHYSYRIYADPEMARTFEQTRFGGAIGEFLKRNQESIVFSQLPPLAGWKVIDVGAGTGRFSLPFLEQGAGVTACDASEEMMKVLRSKTDNARLQTLVVDAHQIPFPDRDFDCAVSFRILMHVIDWKKVLSELCRVSKDWVIIDFPPKRGFLRFTPVLHYLRKAFNPEKLQDYRILQPEEVYAELKKNGFEIIRLDHGYFLPIAVHRFVKSLKFSQGAEKFFSAVHWTERVGAPITVLARRIK